ncbi:hypothetical protein M408DRAFT_23013 [Serendipita vermifera MAFF 305830]|uniref:Pentacotripeptide-repeat region of PRORP domain-containing protein n=1 Tax=Serendipita vermifera MAFF 305830 TaxID=933852 RepID=A0A0C3BCQ2_SERVB|nr:hypothetical protein M408DRAFT_23013 [Serendipita vermifera MAFF 305830]
MSFRLPLGLLEITALSLASRSSHRLVSRTFHSDVIYPSKLSITGNQVPVKPQQTGREDHVHSPLFQQPTTPLSEEELQAIYQDLLRHDAPPPVEQPFADSIPDPALVLPRLTRRIVTVPEINDIPTSFSSKLQSRLSQAITQPTTVHHSQGKPYSDLLNALQKDNFSPSLPILGESVTKGVMTLPEWTALIEACLKEYDADGAFTALRVMKKLGTPVPWDIHQHVLQSLAEEGLFREIQAYAHEFLPERTDAPHFVHLITALSKCRLYNTALSLLHTQEVKGHYPPQTVYQALIVNLMRSPTPGNTPRRAKAWDLFYHMRYVAHPTPSISLYTDMIRACADAAEPETLRGFDLWTEMTVDKRMTPTTEAYNAIIALAARNKSTALEATRLAKEMVEFGRDAEGRPAMPLTKETYIALLEAAKRLGDLKQARWILMKLARAGPAGTSAVDHWALRHIFHTYATYSPPFKRQMATIKPRIKLQNQTEHLAKASQTPEDAIEGVSEIQPHQTTGYDALLPQTTRALLSEADALFDLLLREKSLSQEDTSSMPLLFSSVSSLPEIVSAYFSVYLNHAPSFSAAVSKIRAVHAQTNFEWTPELIRICMVHCARRVRPGSLNLATEWADELWSAWSALAERERGRVSRWLPGAPTTPAERRVTPKSTISAPTVSSIWAAYIQLKAKANTLDDAMALVRRFEEIYPPSDAKANLSPEMPTESRVVLAGARTLVRTNPRGLIDDDSVPPILAFTDVATLHKALLHAQRSEDVGYLTYLLHAYAGGVRDRRGMNLLVSDVKEGWKGKEALGNEVEVKVKAKRRFEKRKRNGRVRPGLRRW